MTSRLFAIALGMLLAAAPMLAQARAAKADALSGTWAGELNVDGRTRSITLELKFDGTSKVTGTASGLPNPADVKGGTFNPKTGALKLELGKQGDSAVLLVLEGTIAKGAGSGRVSGDATGEFKLAKKKGSSVASGLANGSAKASTRMLDGKQWTTANLNVNTSPSYCYDDAEQNCRRYGRLYTWESAQRGCRSLGDGWRLPTDDEWRQMTKRYGGVSSDSDDKGKAAYKALSSGGSTGFNAVLGGLRSPDGEYTRLDAHGLYWTASEGDPATATFYNFGKGGLALHRQSAGEKQRAFSVRCVRD